MELEGTIHDGVVVFDEQVPLPEGTRVTVTAKPAAPAPSAPAGSLLDRYRDVIGLDLDLPTDGAANVDHYLYGHPKK